MLAGMAHRRLAALFAPESVAVVGASHDPQKWGGRLARGALKGAHRRRVGLVNRSGGEILGSPAYRSLADLPAPAELVVACVPPASFAATVDDAVASGARAIVGISAGVDPAEERAIGERVRAAGAVLLGPNCLGVFDRDEELDLAPWVDFPPGEIGLIAQSGNVSLELALLAERERLGFSRFASLGNQADVEAAELVEEFGRHDATHVIALYIEDFRDGRAFARAAAAAGKPVVLLAAGVSDAGRRAARSHTGALVSDLAAVDAACRAAGIVRVSTPLELIDVAGALLRGGRLRGRRIAVIGDGGGHGVVAADVATQHGLEVPPLSDTLSTALARELPPTATTTNPVDFAGGAEQDVTSFARVARHIAASGEVDALLVTGYFGGYGTETEREVATALAALDLELVVHTLYPGSAAADALRAGGALVYGEIERAVRSCSVRVPSETRDIPLLPEDALEPVADGYFASRALLSSAGIPLAEARPARTAAAALVAADELGYPVVLKDLSREHKSDEGGVLLDIGNRSELEAAFGADGEWSVERMAPLADGVELIVGVRRDVRFGPILLVGLGGIYAEVLRDVVVALAPVEPAAAEKLVRSLRSAHLLSGARGRPALDIAAAARAASALSHLAARSPWIEEIEINPLLVMPDGALGLDARVVAAENRSPAA
jgi:acyl-CoA synthetase (NDP forming)